MDKKSNNNNVWAIILNWNNGFDTVDCIKSLKRSVLPITNIVVVDNGSSDRSVEYLKNYYCKDNSVLFLKNKTNVGFGPGIKKGIINSLENGADYIFLVNDDAIVDNYCLAEMVKNGDNDCNVGILGPRIFYSTKPSVVWQGGGYFNYWTGGNVVPEKNRPPKAYNSQAVSVTFLTGCIMLIKSKVFEKIGYFDDDIFFYEEDVDFCLRALKAGFILNYVPSAIAWHKVEGIRITPFAFYNRARSRIIVLRKNFNIIYVWYGILVHIILFTPYKIYQSIKSEKPLETLVAWFKGSIDGVSAKLHYKETSLNKK